MFGIELENWSPNALDGTEKQDTLTLPEQEAIKILHTRLGVPITTDSWEKKKLNWNLN